MGQTRVGVEHVRYLFKNQGLLHFGSIQDYKGRSLDPTGPQVNCANHCCLDS